MKTSGYDVADEPASGVSTAIATHRYVERERTAEETDPPDCGRPETPHYVQYTETELVSPDEILVQRVETYIVERWSDSTSLPGPDDVTSDTEPEPGAARCEPASEMYYTASSEVSLLSDLEASPPAPPPPPPDRPPGEDTKELVMAGHVAAMRERFESMTRTNTPCPDLARSLSPSLDLLRNVTPSPDRLA